MPSFRPSPSLIARVLAVLSAVLALSSVLNWVSSLVDPSPDLDATSTFLGACAAMSGVAALWWLWISQKSFARRVMAGSGGIGGLAGLTLALAFPSWGPMRASLAIQDKARNIYQATCQYAREHNDRMPRRISEILPLLGGDPAAIQGPPPACDPEFFTLIHHEGAFSDLDSTAPVVISKPTGNKYVIVVFSDGGMVTRPREKLHF